MNKQKTYTIGLGEKEVEALINGETIERKLEDGSCINIRQSYFKDISASIINRDKQIFSKSEISNIKAICGNVSLNNSIKR